MSAARQRPARAMFAALGVLAFGCAPGLEEPERFEQDGLCDFDVHEDLFVRRCSVSGCHQPANPQAGLDFVSGDLASRLVGVEATSCPGHQIVDPEDPDASFLLVRLRDDPRCGEEPVAQMPLLGDLLTEEEIECVRRWVGELTDAHDPDAGAPPVDAGPPDAGPPPPDAGPPVDSGMGVLTRVEIEAENMTLEGYQRDSADRNIIRIIDMQDTGTARTTFPGASGTYQLTLHVIAEYDGQASIEIRVGGESVRTITYPRTTTGRNEAMTLPPFAVTIAQDELLELVGTSDRSETGAWARLDKLVFDP